MLSFARSYGTDADGTDYWLMRNSWGTCVGCISHDLHFLKPNSILLCCRISFPRPCLTHVALRSYWGENGWARIKSGVNTLGVETNPCDWAVPA